MEGYCTCGAKLLPDSRFCHRCGRPLRDEFAAEEPVEQAVEDAATVEQTVAVTPDTVASAEAAFQNGTAVRVGFLAAVLMQLVIMLTAAAGAQLLMPLIILGGGFYAVVLYKRRTGAEMTAATGARVGWITGIFGFVITTVFFTLSMALLAGSDDLRKAYAESASNLHLPPEAVKEAQKLFENPATFGASIVMGLVFQFLLLTLISSLGGIIGARLRNASPQPPRQR